MSQQANTPKPVKAVPGGVLPALFEHDENSEATGTVMPFCSETCRDACASSGDSSGLKNSVKGWASVKDFGFTPHCEQCGCEVVKGDHQEPHEMTLGQFRACSKADRLENHGRKWNVIFGCRALGFSDAATEDAAIADVHGACVNNALYLNLPDAPDVGEKPSLPPAEVLAEYPELVAQFPELGLVAHVQHSPEVLALIEATLPFADLLDDEHPTGTVFHLEVHADDVARLKAALLALGK